MFPELPDPAPGYPAALPPPPGNLGELYGDNPERILGQRLRALREDAGMTQAQLAEAMTRWGFSLHQTTIGKIETNQRQVTVNEGVMLATLLGVRLPDLLTDPEPNAETSGLRDELRDATAHRVEIEAHRAEFIVQRDRANAGLSATFPELKKAREAEIEARRRYRLARKRSAGHSASGDDEAT